MLCIKMFPGIDIFVNFFTIQSQYATVRDIVFSKQHNYRCDADPKSTSTVLALK